MADEHTIEVEISGPGITIRRREGYSVQDELTVSDWPEALQVVEVLLIEHTETTEDG